MLAFLLDDMKKSPGHALTPDFSSVPSIPLLHKSMEVKSFKDVVKRSEWGIHGFMVEANGHDGNFFIPHGTAHERYPEVRRFPK